MMSDNFFTKWYAYGIVLMIAMIVIGGITRLTDSGLSMVDWQPVAGILPPITNNDWEQEFNHYKQYPEYKEINLDMTLSEFKIIFFRAFTVPPAEIVLLYPFSLTIFSVIEPTQKHILLVS